MKKLKRNTLINVLPLIILFISISIFTLLNVENLTYPPTYILIGILFLLSGYFLYFALSGQGQKDILEYIKNDILLKEKVEDFLKNAHKYKDMQYDENYICGHGIKTVFISKNDISHIQKHISRESGQKRYYLLFHLLNKKKKKILFKKEKYMDIAAKKIKELYPEIEIFELKNWQERLDDLKENIIGLNETEE